MNKEQLHNYLNNKFDQDSLKELEKLVETYPYFQGARILLSKVSSDEGHHAFESFLNKAAIHTGSRVALFNEVMSERIQLKVASIEKEIEELEVNEPEVQETESEEIEAEIKEDVSPSPEVSVSSTELISEEEKQDIQEEEGKEELLSELMVATGGDERSEAIVAEEPEVSKDLNEANLTRSELDLVEEETEAQVDAKEDVVKFNSMDELEQGVLIGAISRSLELEVTPVQNIAKVEEGDKGVEKTTSHPISIEGSSINAFTNWVYQRAVEMNYVSQVEEEEQKEDITVEDMQGKEKSELIDRFIAFEPKITRGKAGEFKTPEQAAEALLEDDAWVTETLAAIYAQQGNIGKAKKAYKLLSLKFPEKSIYFANQIKKLGSQP
ncbi:MAG: hypothetical protein ACPGWM_03225, partial [Flavobacteriales bacterium]